MEHAKGLLLFLHIVAAVMWVGGLAYVRFVLLPGLGRQQPGVRGPMVADIGPRTVRYLLRLGEATIFFGIVMVLVIGRVVEPSILWSTGWGLSISLGFIAAVAIYAIGMAVTKPVTTAIAATVQAVQAGNPPANAPALLEALAARQRKALTVQVVLGVVAVLTMSVARFS